MKKIPVILIFVFLFQTATGQPKEEYLQKNNVFILLNHHLEKRGTEKYYTSNPDFSIGYERDIFGFGDHRFYAGVRTGFYREYVLTGDGWSHPEKNRFFLGLSPSYMLHFSKNFRFQLNFLYDVLFPDDYNEIWSYWAVEVSFQYFIRDFYVGISATRGVFLFFDPKAYMDKAGIKVGYRF
ncbi:MAG: hypothetical protein KAR19_11950 [Bacteroidales bacterium]|nr:hypothetical protein [Bacteroidales bacterium]